MAITLLYKVLDQTRRCCIKVIATNKVRGEVVFSLPRAGVPVGECTIGAVGEARHIDREPYS